MSHASDTAQAHTAAECRDADCDHTTTQDVDGSTVPEGTPLRCDICLRPSHYTDAGGYRHDHDGTPSGSANFPACIEAALA